MAGMGELFVRVRKQLETMPGGGAAVTVRLARGVVVLSEEGEGEREVRFA